MKPEDAKVGDVVLYKGETYKLHAVTEELPFLDTDEFGHGVVEWSDLIPVNYAKPCLECTWVKLPESDSYHDGRFCKVCGRVEVLPIIKANEIHINIVIKHDEL